MKQTQIKFVCDRCNKEQYIDSSFMTSMFKHTIKNWYSIEKKLLCPQCTLEFKILFDKFIGKVI